MDFRTTITLLLISAGGVLMILALLGVRKIIGLLEDHDQRRKWGILQWLTYFFIAGYAAAVIVVGSGHTEILTFITGVVFFFGGGFVYLTMKSGLSLVQGLTHTSKKSKKRADELESSEQTLKTLNEQLSAQNEALLKFNHVAAHDLQAPLHNISSIITLLEQDHMHEFGEDAQEYLSFISRSSQRMRNLIIALLDYTRIGNDKELQIVPADEVLNDVLEDLGTQLKTNKAKIDKQKLPEVRAHRMELTQLFQNLLTNALKFHRKDTPPVIKISIEALDKHWQFSFGDNGIGIDSKDQGKIFEMFKRIHSLHEFEGSGIGLANCKKIVELHGGKIWVDSNGRDGSTFHFTLAK